MPLPPTRKPWSVLVVCHGNVNRSPLAAAVLRGLLGERRVTSRCLRDKDGYVATKKVREHAAAHGLDLSGHRAVRVSQDDVDRADLVVYMDRANYAKLSNYPGAAGKAVCLGRYLTTDAKPKGWSEERVPDPAYVPRGEYLTELLTAIRKAAANLVVVENLL